ncbi:MAG: fibronectin type III domain-containing protein [Candidatus Ancillula sp.]|jgi:hypothetical protein|nr:fibronectin type III domain-containing protein [Candidatus Ancillula sp.]
MWLMNKNAYRNSKLAEKNSAENSAENSVSCKQLAQDNLHVAKSSTSIKKRDVNRSGFSTSTQNIRNMHNFRNFHAKITPLIAVFALVAFSIFIGIKLPAFAEDHVQTHSAGQDLESNSPITHLNTQISAQVPSRVQSTTITPQASTGANIELSDGDETATSGTGWTYADGVYTINSGATADANLTITGTTTNKRVVVASSATATVTLNGVSIDQSGKEDASGSVFSISAGANVTIKLQGNNTLKSGRNVEYTGYAGLNVLGGSTLTIESVAGTGSTEGSLSATGGRDGAGIGGNDNYSGGQTRGQTVGTITINGGTVTANGAANGAGIGGGDHGEGGSVTINGGTITATGGGSSAGIGGGLYGDGGSVTINGGTVTANGAATGAGIGGGAHGSGGIITITNGTVTANGGSSAAGIGGGEYGEGGSVTINGGKITATGGVDGAGIGGGVYGDGGSVTINGGNITATGGRDGAGIGGGYNGSGGDITIEGGVVIAIAGESVYDKGSIGGVNSSPTDGSTVISGGTVIGIGGQIGYSNTGGTTITNHPVILAPGGINGKSSSEPNNGILIGSDVSISGTDPITVTININLTIPSGATFTIPEGVKVVVPSEVTLTVDGKVDIAGELENEGNIAIEDNADVVIEDGGTVTGDGTVTGKFNGSDVSELQLASKTSTSITINPATLLSTTGQDIEYAISTDSTAPTSESDWYLATSEGVITIEDSKVSFTGLVPNTQYYIFARSKENATHKAGTAKQLEVKTEVDPNAPVNPATPTTPDNPASGSNPSASNTSTIGAVAQTGVPASLLVVVMLMLLVVGAGMRKRNDLQANRVTYRKA